ncbi:MAG: glycosyltransferase family 2 protein [Proteobacteria bacterium]|nr:glycosyltransferase family 2 protein [Pseudomonadota bacterium]
MSQPALSVIVITKNEAHDIEACLASVAFADERIVVDSGSTDDTRERAERLGARVTMTPDWPGFGPQKNRALAQAQGRWVLSLDADERVDADLAAAIRAVVAADGPSAGYAIDRLSSFCGQWMRHGDWYPDRVLRLFRRDRGRFSDDLVHERVIVDGPVGRLPGLLRHHTMPSLADALDKMNRYTSGRALDRRRVGQTGGLLSALSHATWAFCRGYFLRGGFLDGRLGFVLALYVAEGTYYRYLKMAWPESARPD